MAIITDALSIQPIATPALPLPSAPQITAVGQRGGASNDRRSSSRDARGRPSVAFKSLLDAATIAGLTKTLGAEASKSAVTDSDTTPAPRPSKLPNQAEPEVLSAAESEGLYQSAKSSGQGSSSPAPEFLAAATRYAKSYFAVSGTYARPGESLELTA